MFSFFKKQIHDPVAQQWQDLQDEPIAPLALAGVDCDELPGASGPFGLCSTNPIPVNGLLGTYKYLAKLLSPNDAIFYFHRLGSLSGKVAQNVDVYEAVDMNGKHWDILFLDMYHPRRSNKVPPGYRYKPYDKKLSDIPFAFGVDIFCNRFPYDLPEAIEERNALPAFARKVRDRVSRGGFDRPAIHALKVQAVQVKLSSFQT